MALLLLREIIIHIALLLIPFWQHSPLPGIDIATLLTIISLFFAILVGFFIATATSNYLRLQTLIASGNASLISLFQYARLIDPSKAEEIADAIDRYMIRTLDYELLEFDAATFEEFDKVLATIDKVHPSNEEGQTLYQNLYGIKSDLLANNEEMSITSKKIVGKDHWFIIAVLALLIAVLLLALNNGHTLISLIIGILLICLYHILKLIRSIDSNLFLVKRLAYETPQRVFHAIGKLPYYPEMAFHVPAFKAPLVRPYRVGIYTNPLDRSEKRIDIVH